MEVTEVASGPEAQAPDIPLPGFVPEEAEAVPQEAASPEAGAADDAARMEGVLREREAAQREQWRARVESWRDEVARDPELGGERFEASVARAQLALGRFDEGGRIGRLLESSGYGNHPDIVRFFNRLADAVMEDVPAPGTPEGGLAPLEERMYPNWHS
ncbi:MAG: hypothetical protein HDR50_02335 [Desulfovibrio sp.]|uniref:hypothetical protein n=1 Tax=Desulfovibrio sp. TaxID=885 RepID=UPI001A7512E0|nr:hypothetical protein [Desulfovibrio sp.]MBD5416513.1 hypothetical protein [Desulfovibrio sp.]